MPARVTSFRRAEPLSAEPFDIVVLAADERHLRRKRITLAHGEDVLVEFAQAVHLADGDLLVLEDGRAVRVVAAAEALMEVHARNPRHLLQIAWHIGNRHLPAEIREDRILLRRDPVIRRMLEGLGAEMREVTVPFQPEHGAYHAHPH
jgi:urease accessory protein